MNLKDLMGTRPSEHYETRSTLSAERTLLQVRKMIFRKPMSYFIEKVGVLSGKVKFIIFR